MVEWVWFSFFYLDKILVKRIKRSLHLIFAIFLCNEITKKYKLQHLTFINLKKPVASSYKMNLTSENITFNCTGFSNQIKEPLYCSLFENRPSKVFAVSTGFILTIVDIVMCYTVIWYERFGTDNDVRTSLLLIRLIITSSILVFTTLTTKSIWAFSYTFYN